MEIRVAGQKVVVAVAVAAVVAAATRMSPMSLLVSVAVLANNKHWRKREQFLKTPVLFSAYAVFVNALYRPCMGLLLTASY